MCDIIFLDNVKNWIVLDDLDLNNIEIAKHQIRTNKSNGLTTKDIIRAQKLLSRE